MGKLLQQERGRERERQMDWGGKLDRFVENASWPACRERKKWASEQKWLAEKNEQQIGQGIFSFFLLFLLFFFFCLAQNSCTLIKILFSTKSNKNELK